MVGIGGSIDDVALQTVYGHKLLYWHQASVLLAEAAPNLIASEGTGGANLVAIVAASEQVAFAMATGDEVYWQFVLDEIEFLDRTRDMHARVIYTSLAAGTGVDWTLDVKAAAAGVAAGVSDAKVSPDATLAFAAAAPVADGYDATEYKAMAVGGTFANDLMLMLACTLADSGTLSANQAKLIAVDIRYTVQFSDASGVRQVT